MMIRVASFVLALGAFIAPVIADHSISVVNRCGRGTPMMYGPSSESPFQNGPVNIAGGFHTNDDIRGIIIYLQTGGCGQNGENCLVVEASLLNPAASGGQISAADISRIPTHAFNVPVSFAFWPSNQGASCNNANCACNSDAYCSPNDNGAVRGDSAGNTGLTVTFC